MILIIAEMIIEGVYSLELVNEIYQGLKIKNSERLDETKLLIDSIVSLLRSNLSKMSDEEQKLRIQTIHCCAYLLSNKLF